MATEVGEVVIRFTGDTGQLDRTFNRVESDTRGFARSFGSNMQRAGGAVTRFGASMGVLAAPMTAVLGFGIKSAMDFESAFAGVVKTVDGTDDQLNDLKRTIRDMATSSDNPLAGLDDAHVTIARIMELGGQLGVPIDMLDEFAQTIGELTLSTDLTAESASMMLAQFAAITGMDFDDMDNLGSTIVGLGNNFATTESQIVEFMQRLAGAMSTFGFTEADIAGFAAAMASVGLNPEAGGTAMTRVLTEFQSVIVKGGPKLERFAELAGMTTDAFSEGWLEDPTTNLLRFIDGLGSLSAAELEQTLEFLDLDDIRVADTLRRLAGSSDQVTEAVGMANEAWFKNNALNEESGKRFKTTAAQWALAKNRVKDLAITLGEALLPAFNDLLTALGPIFSDFSDFLKENPRLVQAFAILAVAVGAIAAVAIPVGLALSALGTIIAAIASPIGLVVVALAALGAAYATNLLGFRDAVQSVVEAFQSDGLRGAVEQFGEILGNIFSAENIGNVASWLNENILQPILGWIDGLTLEDVGDFIADLFDLWINTNIDIATWAIGFIADIAGAVFDAVSNITMEDIGNLAQIIWDIWKFGLDLHLIIPMWIYNNVMVPIWNAISSITLDDIGNLLETLWMLWEGFTADVGVWVTNNILTPLAGALAAMDTGSIIATLTDLGVDMLNAIKDGFIGMVTGAATAIQNAVNDLIPDIPSIDLGPLGRIGGSAVGGPIQGGNIPAGTGGTGGRTRTSPTRRATGGGIPGLTLVGEMGPELFIPSTAGSIVNTHSLRDIFGGNNNSTGGGDQIIISGPINVYGVQDVEGLYTELEKVGQRRTRGSSRMAVNI